MYTTQAFLLLSFAAFIVQSAPPQGSILPSKWEKPFRVVEANEGVHVKIVEGEQLNVQETDKDFVPVSKPAGKVQYAVSAPEKLHLMATDPKQQVYVLVTVPKQSLYLIESNDGGNLTNAGDVFCGEPFNVFLSNSRHHRTYIKLKDLNVKNIHLEMFGSNKGRAKFQGFAHKFEYWPKDGHFDVSELKGPDGKKTTVARASSSTLSAKFETDGADDDFNAEEFEQFNDLVKKGLIKI